MQQDVTAGSEATWINCRPSVRFFLSQITGVTHYTERTSDAAADKRPHKFTVTLIPVDAKS